MSTPISGYTQEPPVVDPYVGRGHIPPVSTAQGDLMWSLRYPKRKAAYDWWRVMSRMVLPLDHTL